MSFLCSRVNAILRASGTRSQFDETLKTHWIRVYNNGKCRYQLPKPTVHRVMCCVLNPVVLVIPERFRLRRAPIAVSTLDDPVSGFNFTHVPTEEILLHVTTNNDKAQAGQDNESVIVINISPFAFLHSLFVPQPSKLFNQRLRKHALEAAVECFLLSGNNNLCMGFNSLLALASVNHLHFHIWETPEMVYAMTAMPVVKNRLSAYAEFPEHPVHNFVLELAELDQLDNFISSLWQLVESCHSEQIAHNLFFCRSTSGMLRAVFWPRRSVSGAKSLDDTSTQIAVAELAGLFVVPDEQSVARMVPHSVLEAIQAERLSDDAYARIENRLVQQQQQQ